MTTTTDVIRILSVDNQPLLRSGIDSLIAAQPDRQLVGEASATLKTCQGPP
jgi:DNA-binding NarL/FixJ family response regulator